MNPLLLVLASLYFPITLDKGDGANPRPEPTAVPTSAPTHLILNEVGFMPVDGKSQYVELINAGAEESSPSRLRLTTSFTATYQLPIGLPSIPPDGILLVVFDGADRVEAGVVHADRVALLAPSNDELVLSEDAGVVLDRIAWGRDIRDNVTLGSGGVVDPVAPDSSLGRLPGTARTGSPDWALYRPTEATPGGPNGVPAVSAFPMQDGLIVAEPRVLLEWYASPGAVAYELDLARDESFAPLVASARVSGPAYTTPELEPGDYVWRVRAKGADGALSAVSVPVHLTVESSARTAAKPDQNGSLSVPMIKQRKDTKMLLVDGPTGADWRIPQKDGAHAWDVAHPDLDTSDPADNTNCGLATVAMVTAFFGGLSSQDRLGFELFGGGGPQGDLKWAKTLNSFDVVDLLTFTLGEGVVAYFALGQSPDDPGATPAERDAFWQSATAAIDNGQPVPICGGGHCVVMTGYSDGLLGSKRIHVNDPWRGPATVSLRHVPLVMYAFPPVNASGRSDEETVTSDSDGDGVVDFDELWRFGTDFQKADSDDDQVPDKAEIKMSVFDPDHGYAYLGDAREPIDGDDLEPENDPDSDGGKCDDGLEDWNQDGELQRSARETSPYESDDDGCVSGFTRLYHDVTRPVDGRSQHLIHEVYGEFSLKPNDLGELEGSGRYYHHIEGELRPGISCDYGYWPRAGVQWASPLHGTNVNGLISVERAPTSPVFTVSYIECGVTGTSDSTSEWIPASGQLVDGVYDLLQPFDVSPGTGEYWIQIHIEQAMPVMPRTNE